MRYELAIMLPSDDKDSINILGLCFLMVTIITVITSIGLFLGSGALLSILNAQDLAPYVWLVPPFIFVSGLFLALNYWNSRTRHYGRLSIARVTSAVTTTGTQLGAGFGGFASGGSLIGASLVGSAVSTGVLGGQIWREDGALIKRYLSWNGIVAGLKRYKKFPLIDSTSALLNTISWQLPVLLLSAFFSPVIVGFYALGMMVLQTPMSFIGGAIAQVFFQRAAEAKREGTLRPLVENIFKILIILGLFPMMVLLLIGDDLFSVIFGSQWNIAGIYIQILSVWAFVWFISSPLSTVVAVLEKQSWGLFLNSLVFSTRMISIIIGGMFGDVIIALILFSLSGFIIYGYLCIKIMNYSQIPVKDSLKIIFSNLLQVIPIGLILVLLVLLNIDSLIMVIFACILGLVYYMYNIKHEPLLKNLLDEYILNQLK
jgi:O-antigen/teichoic acid export membrane protein